MRRIAPVLATAVVICLLRVSDGLAGGGFFNPPPDRIGGTTLHMSVVMAGPQQPSSPSPRQFTATLDRENSTKGVMFTGLMNYQFGCEQPFFVDLRASTEQRFLGFMNNWVPPDVLDALIRPFGDPDRAVIVDIHDTSCTQLGDQEYLYFTARIKFAR
jgi:hypothetical protein